MTVAELGHLVAELDKRLSPSAKKVLEKRYLKRTPEGVPLETPADMFARVAENIAQADLTYHWDLWLDTENRRLAARSGSVVRQTSTNNSNGRAKTRGMDSLLAERANPRTHRLQPKTGGAKQTVPMLSFTKMNGAGNDFVMIDTEHAPIDSPTLNQMVIAIAEADGPAPLVRIAQATVENIKRALDSGAYGRYQRSPFQSLVQTVRRESGRIRNGTKGR